MSSLAPRVLELAGCGLSPYYKYILQMSEKFPAVSAFGAYYGADGTRYSYEKAPDKAIADYFFLEYANILNQGNRDWYHLKTDKAS